MTSIFHYTDYHKYLKDYFAEAKKTNRGFSHRFLAQKLGLSTSNFIMLVMQGKRNLTPAMCFKLSQAFKHKPKEADYFESMVWFSQAKDNKEKDKYFSRMMFLRRNLKIQKIEEQHYTYLSNWYNPIVRELVTHNDFKNDYAKLAKQLKPAITPAQAKKSVSLLLDLGFIIKKGNKYAQSSPVLSTGPEVESLAIVNFHRAMAKLAEAALDSPKTTRNITSCTLNISEISLQKIIEELAKCRENILLIAQEDEQSDRVFQCNFQLFPVSTIADKE